MRSFMLLAAGLFLHLFCNAGDGEYAVLKIPQKLLNNANAVVRLHEVYTELQKDDRLFTRERMVVTILNEEGSRFSGMFERYDKFNDIKSVEGYLYDALGIKLKTLKSKELEDGSGTSAESLIDDSRYKRHNFFYRQYPYTVEYVVETVKKETMFFAPWIPVLNEMIAVEKSTCTINTPSGYQLRYKTFNYDKVPVVREEKDRKYYTWELVSQEAVKREYASPGWLQITPAVYFAPSEFVIEDFRGNMNDWNELGKFQYSLNQGRDQLPPAIKSKVAELLTGATSDVEKVTRLYQYLQENTRYVSIQLGIGGWRPLDAGFVASKQYGDCKALSNYMYTLLKEAGISSHYTLIKAGDNEDDIFTDFPARQFNHVILCVPLSTDTVWLECTSQTKAPGYMGGFTGNRHALLITENGGKLVATPQYGLKENTQIRTIKAILDETGNMRAEVNSVYSCMQQDDLQMLINALTKDKVKEYLQERLDFATYEVENFTYRENKSKYPSIEEQLTLQVSKYATITGKRLFIVPNIMTRQSRRLSQNEDRKYPVELGVEYMDADTVEITIPPGYSPESVPAPVDLETRFGRYKSMVKLEGNRIHYIRRIEHFAGLFKAADYPELVKFYDAMYKADRAKLVLVKQEPAARGF